MIRSLLLAVLISFLVPPSIAPCDEFRLNGHVFTLPAGFTIELAAKAPVVDRPITASFDERGRLYVSDSSGSNDKVDKQLAEKPHRILRIEDSDGDGVFDKHTVFADKMMFPEGTLWHDGSLFVSAPPSIWKLTDTNGDGVADRREEWLKQTLTSCANDLHGPYLGRDGWIYWAKGAFAEQTYPRPGGKPFVTKAAHIFRAKPDGSNIEPVMTGGMDNPVDVVFTAGGERIFTTTFLTRPSGGQRDGLIHAIYGGVYGKTNDVLEGHPRTGELMPTLVHLGPAAPCGLATYESKEFGDGYRGNLFACLFNMHKVTRHVLTPSGATFESKNEDFVLSDSLDFHPTDVIEDADGSLLIVDTGGWYKLCCPTSQLHKPDILGAIYRVRKKDAPRIADPRGGSIDWHRASIDELIEFLASDRFAIRDRAMIELPKRGTPAIAPLEAKLFSKADPELQTNAVWTLARIDDVEARGAVRQALGLKSEQALQAAAHVAGLHRDRRAVPQLIALLKSSSAQNRRAAAEALGRIRNKEAAEPLLAAAEQLGSDSWRTSSGRVLEHSLIYALIEIGDIEGIVAYRGGNPSAERVQMIALDQVPGGKLSPTATARDLSSPVQPVAEAAGWVVDHHPEWGESLAFMLERDLADKNLTEQERAQLERHLARFFGNPSIQALAAKTLENRDTQQAIRQLVLQSLRSSSLRNLPSTLEPALKQFLLVDGPSLKEAIAVLRGLPPAKERAGQFSTALRAIAADERRDAATRLDAASAIPGGAGAIASPLFQFLRKQLDPELSVATRMTAADVFAKSALTPAQLAELTQNFEKAGPMEADRLLGCYENCTDEAVGTKLVAALEHAPVLTSLRVDSIRTRIAKQPPAVQKSAEKLYARINVDLAKQKAKIETMLPMIAKGDIRRGQAVFARAKAACATCHQFGYVGGNIGPDLTKIGSIRSERDLLESILFPSASFVRSFEPVQLVTKEGKLLNGLVKSESREEIVLVASATETHRVIRDDVEEMRPSSVSIMPAGLDQQLTAAELADLVAFLKNAK